MIEFPVYKWIPLLSLLLNKIQFTKFSFSSLVTKFFFFLNILLFPWFRGGSSFLASIRGASKERELISASLVIAKNLSWMLTWRGLRVEGWRLRKGMVENSLRRAISHREPHNVVGILYPWCMVESFRLCQYRRRHRRALNFAPTISEVWQNIEDGGDIGANGLKARERN